MIVTTKHLCKTRTDLPKDYIQKTKEDWWKCLCGKFHKGFPYKCPFKQQERRRKL